MKVNDLKAEFVRKGYTQQQVADLMGISLKTLYNKLNNKNKRGGFTDKECQRLCEILDLQSIDFWVRGEQNE